MTSPEKVHVAAKRRLLHGIPLDGQFGRELSRMREYSEVLSPGASTYSAGIGRSIKTKHTVRRWRAVSGPQNEAPAAHGIDSNELMREVSPGGLIFSFNGHQDLGDWDCSIVLLGKPKAA